MTSRKRHWLIGDREIASQQDKPRVTNITLRGESRMTMDEVLAIISQAIEDQCHGIAFTYNGVTITLSKAIDDAEEPSA